MKLLSRLRMKSSHCSKESRPELSSSQYETRAVCAMGFAAVLFSSFSAWAVPKGISFCRKELGAEKSTASFKQADHEIVDALNKRIMRTIDPEKPGFELAEAPLHSSLEGKKLRAEDWFGIVKATAQAHEEKFWGRFGNAMKDFDGNPDPKFDSEKITQAMKELERQLLPETIGLFKAMGLTVLPINFLYYSRNILKVGGQSVLRPNGNPYYYDHAIQEKRLGLLVLPEGVEDVPAYIRSGGLLTFYFNAVLVAKEGFFDPNKNTLILNLHQLIERAHTAKDIWIQNPKRSFAVDSNTFAQNLIEEAKLHGANYANQMEYLFDLGFELDENGRPVEKRRSLH